MNEQIKRLAIQSGLAFKLSSHPVDVSENGQEYAFDELNVYDNFDHEKFAELIVNQCAAIVSLYRRDNLQDKAVADTLESAYREIKLSFGLKL